MIKSPGSKSLEQLDENFQSKSGNKSLLWIDAFEKSVAIRGLAWLEENRPHRSFRRLPDRAAPALSEGVQILSYCPSSVFLSFFTDSTDVSVRLELSDLERMDHMPSTGQSGAELYFRERHCWYAAATAKPSGERAYTCSLINGASCEWREYRLYLPLYKRITTASLGIDPVAKIAPSPMLENTRPIVFYGTSITQGGCANTAGSDLVSQAGRMLDNEVINFGFSGNGKGEPEIAHLMSEINAEMFVLDYVANVEPDLLRATLPIFVSILRQNWPSTPIVLMGNVSYNQTLWNENLKQLLDRKRDVIMSYYLSAKGAGDSNIHFIDGNALLGPGESGIYVDGIHPTSGGFSKILERLIPQLSNILLWNRRRLSR